MGQGSSITWPCPPHCGQGWLIEKKPWLWASMPRPSQRGQVTGTVPGLGTAAVAGRAAFGLRHGDLHLRPVDRLVEAEGDLGFEIAAANLLRLGPPAASAEEVGEDVADVEAAGLRPARPERPAGPAPAEAAEHPPAGVVLLPLLRIGERVVGPLDLLELLLRLGIVGIAVRVVLAHQLAVRLLDLLLGGSLGYAKRLVEVVGHAPLRAHHHTQPAGSAAPPAGTPSARPRRPFQARPRPQPRSKAPHAPSDRTSPPRVHGLDPAPRQGLPQAAKHEQHPVRKPVLRVPLRIQPRSLNSPLQIIQHRHHLPNHLSFPPSARSLHLSRHPLPVVSKSAFVLWASSRYSSRSRLVSARSASRSCST